MAILPVIPAELKDQVVREIVADMHQRHDALIMSMFMPKFDFSFPPPEIKVYKPEPFRPMSMLWEHVVVNTTIPSLLVTCGDSDPIPDGPASPEGVRCHRKAMRALALARRAIKRRNERRARYWMRVGSHWIARHDRAVQ